MNVLFPAPAPFHQYLRSQQQKVELTNAAIASHLNVAPNVISMIMRGEMKLPIARIADMASLLRVPLFELLDRMLSELEPEHWRIIVQAFNERDSGRNKPST